MSINKVFIQGNIVRDAQLRHTGEGTAVCAFRLASSRRFKEKEETCFIDCTLFGNRAEALATHLAKGNPIIVEGRLRFEEWTGREGQRRSKHSIVIEDVQFTGGRDNVTPAAQEADDEVSF